MIDESMLQDFIGNRKDIKKPMTDRAVKMLVRKLETLERQGYCPNLLMQRSIINGWQDVYPSDDCKQKGFIEKVTDTSWADGLRVVK